MRSARPILQQAWSSHGRGALFSTRSPQPIPTYSSLTLNFRRFSIAHTPLQSLQAASKSSSTNPFSFSTFSTWRPKPRQTFNIGLRNFTSKSPKSQEVATTTTEAEAKDRPRRAKDEEEVEEEEEKAFEKTDRADRAAQLNMSARLSKDGSGGQGSGWQEILRLLRVARPEAKTLALAVVFLMISSSVSMSIPFSIGKILDIATNNESAKNTLFGFDLSTFYIALASVLTLGAAANFGRVVLLRIVGERVVTRLRSQLYRKTFVQDAEFFDANRVGDLISRLGSDTIIVGKSITQNLSDGLRSLISGVAGFSLMAYVSLKLTGVLAILFPPVAVGAFVYGRAIRNLSRKIQKNLGTLTKIAEERLGNVRTSQAFAGEIQEVGRYNRQVRRIFDLGRREAFISATFFGASGWAGNMTILALLYVGGSMVSSGAITIGELTSFLMYTAYAGSSMFGLSGFYSELMKGVGAASRLFELQDREPTLSPTKGDKVTSLRGPIKFDHVSFAYPTRPAVNIFRDLSFEIQQGSNIAIVAPSGAGKSTVASLLMRFYVPSSGTITINGKDITKMNVKQLRRKIGYVGQEPVLFSGTIAENIAYGKPHATRTEIVNAARRANCTFISDFPDGLETQVGARGTQLSGGQKQRIAIARALLKAPDILILDEATSALDAESETLVNEALGKLMRGNNTTISIAHRLSTITRADLIVVIGNDGKIAEIGTYKNLSANPEGAFSQLMEWQMSGENNIMAARKDRAAEPEIPPEEEQSTEAAAAEQARERR